jgi:hypothetical protein
VVSYGVVVPNLSIIFAVYGIGEVKLGFGPVEWFILLCSVEVSLGRS